MTIIALPTPRHTLPVSSPARPADTAPDLLTCGSCGRLEMCNNCGRVPGDGIGCTQSDSTCPTCREKTATAYRATVLARDVEALAATMRRRAQIADRPVTLLELPNFLDVVDLTTRIRETAPDLALTPEDTWLSVAAVAHALLARAQD